MHKQTMEIFLYILISCFLKKNKIKDMIYEKTNKKQKIYKNDYFVLLFSKFAISSFNDTIV